MSKTIECGRLCNQVIRNLAVHFIAKKFNLSVDYSNETKIKELGIDLFCGQKKYKYTIDLTDETFFSLLNIDTLEFNLDANGYFFQTEEITNYIRDYLHSSEIKQKIMNKNIFKERYNNNNDVFIHIRLGDVQQWKLDIKYYLHCLEKIQFDTLYISSDSPDHPLIQELQLVFPNAQIIRKNEVETIHFGSTCKYIILSHGSFSGVIGFLSFFATHIFYCTNPSPWCPMGIFTGKGWIGVS